MFLHLLTLNQVALNEQFMVAGLGNAAIPDGGQKKVDVRNRVLDVLISRLGSSKTFGENMIFMLNRACTCYRLFRYHR